MRAQTNFLYWLRARVGQVEAQRLFQEAQDGQEEALDLFRSWLCLGGLGAPLDAAVASGRARIAVGVNDRPSREDVGRALQVLQQADVRPMQIVAARCSDIEKNGDGWVWHLRSRCNWLARDLVLNGETKAAVRTLARFGRTGRPAADEPLLCEVDGRPWTLRQVSYRMH